MRRLYPILLQLPIGNGLEQAHYIASRTPVEASGRGAWMSKPGQPCGGNKQDNEHKGDCLERHEVENDGQNADGRGCSGTGQAKYCCASLYSARRTQFHARTLRIATTYSRYSKGPLTFPRVIVPCHSFVNTTALQIAAAVSVYHMFFTLARSDAAVSLLTPLYCGSSE
eukprot:TRINITY_DN9446_c0_g1_i10.p1 TRINITY_DN9446_c0_g1~~TRINITY_DN9446_c0_g1_i10.p1  ORF type:complete len:169 (+),score=0.65 TRINITY_DN9446_c0_g1_i10:213-719(+)